MAVHRSAHEPCIISSLPSHHRHRVSQILCRRDRWRTGVDRWCKESCLPASIGCSSRRFPSGGRRRGVAVDSINAMLHCRTDPLPTWLAQEVQCRVGAVQTAGCAMYRCVQVTCQSRLRLHTSLRCLRKPIWRVPMLRTMLSSPTCQSSQSCWSESSCGDYWSLGHLKRNDMLHSVQSAYHKCHSTEATTARVLSDILTALNRDDVAALALLDLSAAFDTVDHGILLRRLHESYNIGGAALTWISSYVTGRRQCVVHSGSQSSYDSIAFGVPQGSVLGLLLFVSYTANLVPLIQKHSLHCHLYAGDNQVYGWCQPHDAVPLQDSMSEYIDDVLQWTSSNRRLVCTCPSSPPHSKHQGRSRLRASSPVGERSRCLHRQ